MNRSTVEKAIERVVNRIGEGVVYSREHPSGVSYDLNNAEDLRALTELLAHYPKEEDVKGNGSTAPFGTPDRYCCGVHTVCGYEPSIGKCRY